MRRDRSCVACLGLCEAVSLMCMTLMYQECCTPVSSAPPHVNARLAEIAPVSIEKGGNSRPASDPRRQLPCGLGTARVACLQGGAEFVTILHLGSWRRLARNRCLCATHRKARPAICGDRRHADQRPNTKSDRRTGCCCPL